MYEIRFYIGQDSDCFGQPIPATERKHILQSCIARILESYDGYTCYVTNGGWKDEANQLVQESGIVLEVISTNRQANRDSVIGVQHDLEIIARQTLVGWTIKECAGGF